MTDEVQSAGAMPANLDQVVAQYLALREGSERIMKEAEAKVVPMKAAMKTIESYFMKLVNETGQTKFGTPSGTAFRDTKTGCNVKDWDTFLTWMREQQAFFLLNKAVNKTAVKEYMDAHGTPPPGIEWIAMHDIKIRRT